MHLTMAKSICVVWVIMLFTVFIVIASSMVHSSFGRTALPEMLPFGDIGHSDTIEVADILVLVVVQVTWHQQQYRDTI